MLESTGCHAAERMTFYLSFQCSHFAKSEAELARKEGEEDIAIGEGGTEEEENDLVQNPVKT